jgi:alkanesulfonate monooxygenase SsuD/methylene tetrahydromethanopterin reductase-like flavin-dependent oxidoreductase (luciferase family)
MSDVRCTGLVPRHPADQDAQPVTDRPRWGLMVDGEDGWSVEQWTRFVIAAEEAGFDSVHRSDHLWRRGEPTLPNP